MTYCLGIKINKGLLFMSDTRTNAGVDNISTFKKIFTFNYKEKVYITILASGNLAPTQFLVNSILSSLTSTPLTLATSVGDYYQF